MAAEVKKEIQLEIGHVLFIDIVGYSKLFITEQSEQLRTLKEIVRATEQFRIAEAAGKLLRLSTGDGGALVSHRMREPPALFALLSLGALTFSWVEKKRRNNYYFQQAIGKDPKYALAIQAMEVGPLPLFTPKA